MVSLLTSQYPDSWGDLTLTQHTIPVAGGLLVTGCGLYLLLWIFTLGWSQLIVSLYTGMGYLLKNGFRILDIKNFNS